MFTSVPTVDGLTAYSYSAYMYLRNGNYAAANALLSSPASLTPECRKSLHSKQPPVCRKFSGDDHFELPSERNLDLLHVLFLRGRVRPRGQSVLAVGSHSLVHVLG